MRQWCSLVTGKGRDGTLVAFRAFKAEASLAQGKAKRTWTVPRRGAEGKPAFGWSGRGDRVDRARFALNLNESSKPVMGGVRTLAPTIFYALRLNAVSGVTILGVCPTACEPGQ